MELGSLIDIWVVEKQLGSGGMGSVYRCHNRQATRILAAIKVLDSSVKRSAGGEERFIREAEILFQLDHPNIVKVRNVRTDTDPAYLEMEFIQGESLDHILERGPVPVEEAHRILQQVLDALAYLHARQIRHRDIKPANVLIQPDGRVKLVDFGLAMEADASRLTQTGTTFGTVSYAPPEWISPEATDAVKWDIYAAGVMFWEMLTGQVAFPMSGQGSVRQQALQVILAKQRHAALDPGPAYHEPLRALIREMTDSDADRRASSADALLKRALALPAGLAAPDLYQSLAEFATHPSHHSFSERTWIEDAPRTPTPAPTERTLPPTPPLPEAPSIAAAEPRSYRMWFVAAAGLGAAVVASFLAVVTAGLYWQTSQEPVANAPAAAIEARPASVAQAPMVDSPPHEPVIAPPAPVPPISEPPRTKPVPAPTAAAQPVAEPHPRPEKKSAPRWVTRKAFAIWLTEHPDWSKDAAIERRAADASYLADWVNGAPPQGTESQAMVNAPWSAATKYCRGRGGLPEIKDDPRSWSETDPALPPIEWRVKDGQPAWYDATGRESTAVRASESNSMTGFRCKN